MVLARGGAQVGLVHDDGKIEIGEIPYDRRPAKLAHTAHLRVSQFDAVGRQEGVGLLAAEELLQQIEVHGAAALAEEERVALGGEPEHGVPEVLQGAFHAPGKRGGAVGGVC